MKVLGKPWQLILLLTSSSLTSLSIYSRIGDYDYFRLLEALIPSWLSREAAYKWFLRWKLPIAVILDSIVEAISSDLQPFPSTDIRRLFLSLPEFSFFLFWIKPWISLIWAFCLRFFFALIVALSSLTYWRKADLPGAGISRRVKSGWCR